MSWCTRCSVLRREKNRMVEQIAQLDRQLCRDRLITVINKTVDKFQIIGAEEIADAILEKEYLL